LSYSHHKPPKKEFFELIVSDFWFTVIDHSIVMSFGENNPLELKLSTFLLALSTHIENRIYKLLLQNSRL